MKARLRAGRLAIRSAMALTLEQVRFLQSPAGRRWLETDLPADPLAAAKALRKHLSAAEASGVLEVRGARAKAAAKFPFAWCGELLASDRMVQQASSLRLAAHKARRLAGRGASVLDLCCGMGADAIALALAGARVCACDCDPAAVACAEHNARVAGVADRCRFICVPAEKTEIPAGDVVHADPDRRASGRRAILLTQYAPGPAFLRRLVETAPAGALKLSPALDAAALADWPLEELEHVSEQGVCRQLVAWWGGDGDRGGAEAGAPLRRATVVWGDAAEPSSESLIATDAPAELGEPGEYLLEPDPAVIAAGAVDALAGRLGLRRAAPGLDWLFGDSPPPATRLGRAFRVLESVAGREKDIARALRRLKAGRVEVKPRGVRLDTDALQKRLAGSGARRLAVLWGRLGRSQKAFIAERLDEAQRDGAPAAAK